MEISQRRLYSTNLESWLNFPERLADSRVAIEEQDLAVKCRVIEIQAY